MADLSNGESAKYKSPKWVWGFMPHLLASGIYIHINKYICIGLCIVGDTINIVWSLLGVRLQFPDLVNRYVTRPLIVVKKGTPNAWVLCLPRGIL